MRNHLIPYGYHNPKSYQIESFLMRSHSIVLLDLANTLAGQSIEELNYRWQIYLRLWDKRIMSNSRNIGM